MLVTLFKNHYTEEQLKKLGLNERQIKAVQYIVDNGSIYNSEYQKLAGISSRTALRDLDDLVSKKVLEKRGEKKSTRYLLAGG